jgi:hypothetical protein
MTIATRNLLLGSLKSAGAIAFGAVCTLYKVAPEKFNFNNKHSAINTLWVIAGVVGAAEARYLKQWLINGGIGISNILTGGEQLGTIGGDGVREECTSQTPRGTTQGQGTNSSQGEANRGANADTFHGE